MNIDEVLLTHRLKFFRQYSPVFKLTSTKKKHQNKFTIRLQSNNQISTIIRNDWKYIYMLNQSDVH